MCGGLSEALASRHGRSRAAHLPLFRFSLSVGRNLGRPSSCPNGYGTGQGRCPLPTHRPSSSTPNSNTRPLQALFPWETFPGSKAFQVYLPTGSQEAPCSVCWGGGCLWTPRNWQKYNNAVGSWAWGFLPGSRGGVHTQLLFRNCTTPAAGGRLSHVIFLLVLQRESDDAGGGSRNTRTLRGSDLQPWTSVSCIQHLSFLICQMGC